ncbi:MAG: NifU family protein [Bdellovibrionales bacterium]|nr:NifU family protein [Bdellovibrionales bacterium]
MNTPITPENIKVRAQETPNPNALRFIVNFELIDHGNATFTSPEQAQGMPMIESLFMVEGVNQVYFFENTLTVTHSGLMDNETMKASIVAVIQTRLPIHKTDFQSPEAKTKQYAVKDRSELSPELKNIEEILDRTIRPGLQADGGDLEVLSFENNELRVLYMGACGGCPSATMGTLDAIQNILRYELDNPEIFVIPV